MTDFNICCLCASDEGVFLDIFTSTGHQLGNRSLLKEFETCLSFKVKKSGNLSSKICHKCAIELGECNRFIEKYQQATSDLKKKASKPVAKRSCCLCFTTAKNKYLFTLAKDFRSTIDSLQKLYECLQLQITREEAEGKLICLFCRYNLDVLYDLKKLAREVSPKLQIITKTKAIVDNLPKTETFVVSRKTTVTRHSRIELDTPLQSDSEHDTMARRQLRPKKLADATLGIELKPRICGQCKTLITGGVDMYRLHKMGVTVCKMCWITMDPLKATKDNKRKQKNQAESKSTKLCAVFLKDVLSPTSSKELPVQKVHKVEKATEDEVIYITSDDSLIDEEQSNNRTRRISRRKWAGKAAKSDQEFDKKLRPGIKRSLKEEDAESNGKSMKKLKSMKKTPVNSSLELRRSTRSHNSDSEIVIARKKQRTNSAVEEPQRLQKSNNIRSGNKLGKRKMDRKVPKAKEDVKMKSEDLSATDDDGVVKKLRKVRTEVPLASKSESPDSSRVEKSRKNVKPMTAIVDSKPDLNSPVQKRFKAQSVVTKSPSTKVKASSKRSKTVMMVSFPFQLKDPYECKVCGTIYRNKIVGMKHELTHFKQVEIKIEKLNIPHHFQTINENSATKEIPEESPNDARSLDSSQTNENLSESEVTAPPVDKEDDDNRIDDKTPVKERVPSTDEPELSQQNAKSSDVEDVKEPDAVLPTEKLVTEESTLATKDSNDSKKDETTEREVSAPGRENEESTKDDDTSNNDATEKQSEADLPTESNVDNVDDTTAKDVSEIVKEDTAKESVKDLEETVDDAEDKICKEQKNDKNIVRSVVPLNTENKDEPGNKDLVDDVESDVDIRIVDTGSSAEESSEQVEKKEEKNIEKEEKINAENSNDSSISEDVTDTKEASIKPTDAKESTGTSDDESQTITASNTEPEKETVEENQPADPSPKNEEQTPDEVESPTNDKIDGAPSETANEINGGAEVTETSSAVTEILQEVIDLASAEVKKRAEKEETAAETLEDISNEIKKTASENSGSIEVKTNERTDYDEAETNTTLNDLN